MNSKDMIFCEKNGKVYSCGYNINSLFLENNIKPVHIFEDEDENKYTIPAGLTTFFNIKPKMKQSFIKYGISQDSLYDKLLNLMDNDEKINYKNQKTQKRKMKLKCRRKSCKKKKINMYSKYHY